MSAYLLSVCLSVYVLGERGAGCVLVRLCVVFIRMSDNGARLEIKILKKNVFAILKKIKNSTRRHDNKYM